MFELTPVEFACETMANVEKELCDLIAQYRADPSKNINPFSMRLQGIIDANVMGGISKYQEAFFTEQFSRSAEGKGQLATVHKLKCLIMDQVSILETALELHGQLAPGGVQPLHKRLLERFSQLKHSLSDLGKLIRRPHSDSIVNTPLPPLPTETRSVSLQNSHGIYEKDDIYTRPHDTNGTGDGLPGSSAQQQVAMSREGLLPLDLNKSSDQTYSAPPIPCRPRSACYAANTAAAVAGNGFSSTNNNGLSHSPDIPPKGTTKAPPLPPRGYTPDKRASNPIPFGEFYDDSAPNIPRRCPKYSVINISLEDDDDDDSAEADHHFRHSSSLDSSSSSVLRFNEFRDSHQELETTTTDPDMNNLNNLNGSLPHFGQHNVNNQIHGHSRPNCGSNPERLNIQTGSVTTDFGNNTTITSSSAYPPPIPPKSGTTPGTSMDEPLLWPVHHQVDHLSGDTHQATNMEDEDGYCVPKEVAKNHPTAEY